MQFKTARKALVLSCFFLAVLKEEEDLHILGYVGICESLVMGEVLLLVWNPMITVEL